MERKKKKKKETILLCTKVTQNVMVSHNFMLIYRVKQFSVA